MSGGRRRPNIVPVVSSYHPRRVGRNGVRSAPYRSEIPPDTQNGRKTRRPRELAPPERPAGLRSERGCARPTVMARPCRTRPETGLAGVELTWQVSILLADRPDPFDHASGPRFGNP